MADDLWKRVFPEHFPGRIRDPGAQGIELSPSRNQGEFSREAGAWQGKDCQPWKMNRSLQKGQGCRDRHSDPSGDHSEQRI